MHPTNATLRAQGRMTSRHCKGDCLMKDRKNREVQEFFAWKCQHHMRSLCSSLKSWLRISCERMAVPRDSFFLISLLDQGHCRLTQLRVWSSCQKLTERKRREERKQARKREKNAENCNITPITDQYNSLVAQVLSPWYNVWTTVNCPS